MWPVSRQNLSDKIQAVMMMNQISENKTEQKRKTVFVLSGGSGLGSVQVGMVKALFEQGIIPDFFIGTSVGAINSAYLSGNPTLAGVSELEKIWINVRREDVFPLNFFKSIINVIKRKNFLVSPRGLRNLLERNIHYNTLADARIPCLLTATDLLTGEQVVLTSGNVIDAVLASAALPGIYPPVEIAGRFLMDGGISGNTPLSVAAEYGAEEVFVLSAGYSKTLDKAPSGVIDTFAHSLNILIDYQFLRDIDTYRKDILIHIIPPVYTTGRSFYDLSGTAEYLSLAYEKTRDWLRTGGMNRFEIPGRIAKPNQWL
jgi:NTE family protein